MMRSHHHGARSQKFRLLPLFTNQNNQGSLQKGGIRAKQKSSLVLLEAHVPATPGVTLSCLRLSAGVLQTRGRALQQAEEGFPGCAGGKVATCQWRRRKRRRVIPGSGRSPGGGCGDPLQDSCLEDPLDRGAWRATVHWVQRARQG